MSGMREKASSRGRGAEADIEGMPHGSGVSVFYLSKCAAVPLSQNCVAMPCGVEKHVVGHQNGGGWLSKPSLRPLRATVGAWRPVKLCGTGNMPLQAERYIVARQRASLSPRRGENRRRCLYTRDASGQNRKER